MEHPIPDDSKRVLTWAVIGALIVVVLGVFVRDSAFDFPVTHAFNELNTGFIETVTTAVYTIFGTKPSIVWIVLLSVIIMIARKNVRTGLVFGLTVLFTWLPVAIMKMIYMRPRPDKAELANPSQFNPADWSYPSGHTVIITITMIALIIVTTGTKVQLVPRVLAPALIVLVGFTVLALGVHFPTDMIASIIWGITVTPLMWLGLSALFRVPAVGIR
ncbi:MAG: phosphatase PAP2 family protein [Candidatus Nanopelagicales bacterium]